MTTGQSLLFCSLSQWRRYTKARQVKWPGWKIHRPGSSPGSALLGPAFCFASVIVWAENKNATISDRFICFILTVKRRWQPVIWGRQLQKRRQLFSGKSAFWPRNDLAPLLRWRRHCFVFLYLCSVTSDMRRLRKRPSSSSFFIKTTDIPQ